MKALSSFTISIFLLCTALWSSGINVAHSASCPAEDAYAGIKVWHYLESTQANPYYTQTTEYEGTVGVQFQYFRANFFILNAGNLTITKTIDAKLVSPTLNCTYETATAKVEVYVSSNSLTCTDGVLNISIVENAEATSAPYHCVACSSGGCVQYGGTQVYPATRLDHDILIEYVHEAMVIHQFPEGTGSYSWTLLFRETQVPARGSKAAVPILPLLLND